MSPIHPRQPAVTDALVVGGGFFGAWIALDLARRGHSVAVLERESDLLARASHKNQARVHNGYHYPRSILTGLRSRVNSERFLSEYAACVQRDFTMVYAVARRFSNVTAAQFAAFCERIRAPLREPTRAIRALFDPGMVEAVFEVEEWAFDADRLAEDLAVRLAGAGVVVWTRCEAESIAQGSGSAARLVVRARDRASGEPLSFGAQHVFHCGYSGLNDLRRRSGLELLSLREELTEIVLVDVPPELAHVGVTVMCGPFFSCMPFPPRGLHSLSHVRYTPHASWLDRDVAEDNEARFARAPRRSNATYMIQDAARYLPLAARFEARESMWELKTVLPQSEVDDSRPILFKRDAGLAGLHCVLGGKIDNVYDMGRELDLLYGAESLAS